MVLQEDKTSTSWKGKDNEEYTHAYVSPSSHLRSKDKLEADGDGDWKPKDAAENDDVEVNIEF